MELELFSTIVLCLAITVNSQKYREDIFPTSAQFQPPSSVMFSPDSSIYLPLQAQTPTPQYAFNTIKKLPYRFLPTTGTNAPSFYHTSLPFVMASTFKSIHDKDEDNKNITEYQSIHHQVLNVRPNQPPTINNSSIMRRVLDQQESPISSGKSNYLNAEKRIDMNSNNDYSMVQILPQNFIKPAARRMIVTSEFQKMEPNIDQMKSASTPSNQYLQAPVSFISSTTETAIPIVRLSNEMDLDGSFSYEALGADQTHYVQHSRMENVGTDKEEQVVEGSYSYVGTDGRTYAVRYVADSNGFRASGDHLPVAPPIPEIIQRSIQYNLAEEAKRPVHLKTSWENEEKDYEFGEESRRHIYEMPPPRSLFTGKTPEAFSFGFAQGHLANSMKTENSQPPKNNNLNIIKDQNKSRLSNLAAPISPQITFLASQGARNPSVQSQQTHTKADGENRPPLPQIVNYEAQMKEPEQEANKGLWSWQYGLNSNLNDTTKNSISRSSSDSDDVYINFSDMSPYQYQQIMQSQILGKNIVESNTLERSTEVQNSSPLYKDNLSVLNFNNINEEHLKHITEENHESRTSTVKYEENSYLADNSQGKMLNAYSDLITSYSFTPQSHIATKIYIAEDSSLEPTQMNDLDEAPENNYSNMNKNNNNNTPNRNYDKREYSMSPEIILKPNPLVLSTTEAMENNGFKQQNFEGVYNERHFNKPASYKIETDLWKQATTTTETPIEDIVKQNIFLRNLFKTYGNGIEKNNSKVIVENNNEMKNINLEPKLEKVPKLVPFGSPNQNDLKYLQAKPMDVSDVFNYVVMKNHFESIKTKPTNQLMENYNQSNNNNNNNNNKKTVPYYKPLNDNNENRSVKQQQNLKIINNEQQKEIQGLIKNYKVLQRSKNIEQKNQYLPEPQRNIKAFHSQSQPPLGRAGPSMKSYLPPIYF